jgi:hypothetical protein
MIASHKHYPSPTPARGKASSRSGDWRLAGLSADSEVEQAPDSGPRLRASDTERRDADDQFYAWRFPVQYEIENLRRQLVLVRDESAEFERRGFPSRVLSDLRSDAARLSSEIESLTASLARLL